LSIYFLSKAAPDFCYPTTAENLQNFFGVFLQFHIGVDTQYRRKAGPAVHME